MSVLRVVLGGSRHGEGPDAVQWLVDVDGDGLTSRDQVADRIRGHFALAHRDHAAVLADLRLGLVDHLRLDPDVPAALDQACAAGWTPVVVTNGGVEQQQRKLRHTGLDRHVAGWVISEGAGIRKPDPAIFQLAARQTGQPLTSAWVIGDSPTADIAGAHACDLPSVWLHRGRPWPLPGLTPTAVADSLPRAIEQVLGTAAPGTAGSRDR